MANELTSAEAIFEKTDLGKYIRLLRHYAPPIVEAYMAGDTMSTKTIDGYSLLNGKRWRVWEGKIIAVEEKIAQTFTEEERKRHKALDSALKQGLIRTTDKVMLIVVATLEKTQVILDWHTKFEKKPKDGDSALMFYGRWGYTFPDVAFGKKLHNGVET